MRGFCLKDKRKGQVVVLAPVLFLAIAAIMALTIDVGRIVVEKSRLQNGCDAAAVAGACVLLNERVAGSGESTCRTVAEQDAVNIFHANSEQAGVSIEFGYKDVNGSFVPAAEGVDATLVRASAARDDEAPGGLLPMIIAGLAGVNQTEVEAAAVAEVNSSIHAVTANLCPFAVPLDRVSQMSVGDTMVFYPGDPDAYDNGNGTDMVVPGNWGLLNLDGGDLSTQELTEWIENGTGRLDIPTDTDYIWIDGTSGFRAALNKPVRDKIGDSIVVVIYDLVVGTGSQASYRCVGFVSVTIVGCKLVGNEPFASCRVDEVKSLHDMITGGGFTSPNMRKVQLIR